MNYLNFSKESYIALIKAKYLAHGGCIEPRHILMGLLMTKNLISNILDIDTLLIIKNQKKVKISKIFKFSIESLFIISNLLSKKQFINTVDFFDAILTTKNLYSTYIFKYIPITNLYFYKNLQIQSTFNYIQNLCYYIKFKQISIINRSSEITKIIDVLDRRIKNSFILIGDTGIGRFSTIKGVFNKIIDTKNSLNKKEFYVFDLIQFYTNVSLDTLPTIKNKLSNWILTTFNIVLIIPYLENIYDIDFIDPILTNIFLLLKQKKLQLIITTTISKFSTILTPKIILNNLYESLIIKELPKTDIQLILRQIINKLENFYTIKLPYNITNLLIDKSKIYYPNKVFPLKAIELLEILCSKIIKTYPTISSFTISHFEPIFKSFSSSVKQMDSIKNFKFLLKKRIFGQTLIINKINNVLIKTLSGFKLGNKPIGSWLLCGPSGTGKTELAKGITEVLFGDETKMIRFDMSEFMEKHSISKLIGSPPGYVGYGDKGLLTESVHKQSNCVLLFDEIEKAHPDILNIMLQILDDGRLTDSTGKVINFSHTLIIFTSNLGCPKNISEFKKEFTSNSINYKINEQLIMKSIKQYFKPELINRIQDILIFQPLEFNILLLILNKFIKQFIEQLIIQKCPIKLLIQESLKKYIVKLSISPLYGARPLKRIFDELIVEPTVNILLKTHITRPHLITYTLINNTISYNIIPTF